MSMTRGEQDGQDEGPVFADLAAEHRPLHEIVAEQIRTAILEGDLYPGERLVEDRLARELDVSRHPVREALRVLQTEGFVEISPRRGATVSRISPEEASELFQVLSALDGLAARLATTSPSEEDLAKARQSIAQAKRIMSGNGELTQEDLQALVSLNRIFHGRVADAGNNQQLIETSSQLRDRLQWIQAAGHRRRPELSWAEHSKILEAIDDGDYESAEMLARAHIEAARIEYLADRMGARSMHPT
jgi:DNA-binding GntR family transcriptional regulator